MATATLESTRLTEAQKARFERDGCIAPIRVLDDSEISRYLGLYNDYVARNRTRIDSQPPNKRHHIFSETHFVMKWAFEIASHPRVLDAVESLIGPNILAWNTNWFSKPPGDKTYVSYHQDGTYWKMVGPAVVTAWVALTPSVETNGGLRVVPGSHTKPMLPQRDTYATNNALSRGQEIAVDIDESKAITLALQPGDMSIHHVWIIHGSKANTSQVPRIGLAIRYVSTSTKQESPVRPLAILVRGKDDYGNFELVPKPTVDVCDDHVHDALVDRIRNSIMQGAAKAPAKA